MDLPFLTAEMCCSPLDSSKLNWQLIKQLWHVCCGSLQSCDWFGAPCLDKGFSCYNSWIPDITLYSWARTVDSICLPSNCLL